MYINHLQEKQQTKTSVTTTDTEVGSEFGSEEAEPGFLKYWSPYIFI